MSSNPVKTKTLSLRTRLGIGAAVLGAGSLLTAAILYIGMQLVADRLETALASETRMARYATLSTQAATFLVVATEAVQTGQPTDIRMDRVSPIVDRLRSTFLLLREDVKDAVRAAEALGLDEQARYGTQSLGLARMAALLDSALRGLGGDGDDPSALRAHIDSFASNFDPLLCQAVYTEVLFRNAILDGIKTLRQTLSLTALGIAALSVLLTAGFYFRLIRPQFARLDRLRAAAHRVGQEDFGVALPETRQDEIGQLYSETNRMAAALSDRKEAVRSEWSRLNATIDARTKELRAANVKLSEIDENRRRLFADISHELRTPLTVILMEAQIGKTSGSDARAAFSTIESRAARLNRRIDDLLRVARSDNGQLALDPGPVGIAELIAAVTEEVQAEIDNAGMALTTGPLPDGTLWCDPNWARQVLVGLVRNTIRHAREGGHVHFAADLSTDTADIAVLDNGPGIAGADQARVFDRFSQAGGDKGHGFGIGLALARWVSETQGGDISLTSPVPQGQALGDAPGTKIVVRLPLEEG